MKIDGGCHCGAVRYEAEVDPRNTVVCHCTDCQVISGTAFRTVVLAPADRFALLTGELKTYVKTADSGARRAQCFCPECGTHIYATSVGDAPRTLNLRVGTCSQRDELRPSRQIWCRSALGWLDELGSVERIEKGRPAN